MNYWILLLSLLVGIFFLCLLWWCKSRRAPVSNTATELSAASLLSATLESTADGILVVDNNGKMVSFNERFVEMWRIPQIIRDSRDDQAAIRFVTDQLKSPKIFLEKIEELYAQPEAESIDVLEFKDGRVFERFSKPQKMGRETVGRVWSFRDVTELRHITVSLQELHREVVQRKNIEADLKQSKDYLDKIINSIADPIFVKDRQHRWVLLNDAYCQFMGYPRNELIGKSDYDFFPKEEADVFWMKDELVFESGIENLNEENFTDAKGVKHFILTRKTLYVDPKGQQFIVGVIRDISRRKQAELELLKIRDELEERVNWRTVELSRANESLRKEIAERVRIEEELARSNKELQDFAYVASHDLQEPLHKIIAFADRLKLNAGPELNEKSLDSIERMQKGAFKMRELIDDLLEYARVTTRAKPFEVVNLNTIVDDVLSIFELNVQGSGTQVAQLRVGLLPVIEADRSQMHQLLQNLIGNALKFVKPGEVPQIDIIGSEVGDGFLELKVKDQGIGIEEQFAEQIFKPFQRLHARAEYDGTGMGLAICQKIVSRHGGSIKVKSILGQGATFVVRLPMQQKK